VAHLSSPQENASSDRDDEGAVAAAAAAGGWRAVRLILLGVALEIAAFAVLLLSELWNLPLTFALFAHLNAVYFFTKGFDRRLIEIRLRRELCFFFALIFPLAGMVGIVFYIVVLNRLESRLNLSAAVAAPAAPQPRDEESAFLEDDYFSSLSSAFVRRVSVSAARHDAWHRAEDTPPVDYYREKEYWRREKELAARIRDCEAAEPAIGPETKRLLADTLLEYVTLFHADPRLREHYLLRAGDLYRETGDHERGDRAALEKLVEISFQNRRYKECVSWCDALRRVDAWNAIALLRLGECHFRMREYKRLAGLAREIAGSQAVPAGLKEIAQMWCQYG
jgi:hypothetical protein